MHTADSRGFRIHYRTWGDPQNGRPVVFFHGFPGSHIQAEAMVPFVEPHGLFLIACDRPGYGGSYGRGHAVEFVKGLREILAGHVPGRFDIVGVSGGSPWAHVMASHFADEVRTLTVISGLCPLNNETRGYFNKTQLRGLWLRSQLPALVSEWVIKVAMKGFNPEAAMKGFLAQLDSSDQDILNQPENRELLLRSMVLARAQHGAGIAFDAELYRRNWLHDICDHGALQKVPTYYFHGLRDRVLDVGMAEWMVKRNPRAQIRFFEDEGHYSLAMRQAGAILADVVAAEGGEIPAARTTATY